MALPGDFDGTQDASLFITGLHTVGAATTGNSSASASFNLGDAPCDFTVQLIVSSVSTATGDCAILTIQGSTTSDFSAGNHILGVTAFGATAIINTQIGAGISAVRGTGSYAIRCSNVAFNDTASPVNCPYVRIQVKTVGATSGITYAARLTQSR
jgi:hypothetical protein